MKRTLMKDLAAAAGVSVSQVSRALGQKEDVAPELRQRIHELARAMNYRNCAQNRSRTVAVLCRSFGEFCSGLLNGLQREINGRGWRMAVIPFDSIGLLNDRLYDGAIGLPGCDLARTWHEYHSIPLVLINSYGWMLDRVCSVFPDSNGESRLAMEHLISLGHRKIGRLRLIPGKASEQERSRGLEEFYRVAAEYGIREHVRYVPVPDWGALENELRRMLDEGFTAFIAIFLVETQRLMDLIRRCGRRIPEDVSLVTYEDRALSPYLTPPVTALEYDYDGLAGQALDQLEQEIEGRGTLRAIVVPARLIVRSSTAKPGR
ncbi:MAG: LacI family DNA-binding transcriptional regulator [Lentisphaeria bacterium]|nr:LacI family DNA-binding transcriptional regulator [Lentisphaeria bacterium]